MSVNKTRKFGGKTFTFAGESDTKYSLENIADRIRYKASGSRVLFRILKVESHAPPQGDVFYRLYYRYSPRS